MKTQLKSESTALTLQASPLSFFIKGNIGIIILLCLLLVNINRWSDDAWFAILLMVLGFELVTLMTVLIVKIKPAKKH
ncbi:hypothetical protein [Bacillus massiliglaciei]|uniref:hypothetical protein n=1 Tax=Bacillus massiliglaciei TaxID=1816693 RepID=UPI000DA5F97D|nr:hypothetical protein [Bacillus massiliglaciei]